VIKTISILFLSILLLNNSYGQDELKLYKNIYTTADSLIKSGQIKDIDSTIFRTANNLDKGHPSNFFVTAGELLSESKFNEASFIYYLGLLRYRYFNSVNPDFQASEDGALLASMKYVMGEPINMYLKTDVENFVSIINLSVDYYESNDFLFYSKMKSEQKFTKQAEGYKELVIELDTNKKKYSTQWNEEKDQMKKNIDLWIEESNKN
jgi:hypothetical protein